MQRRVFLLFVLFTVLAGFYATATHESVSDIKTDQKAQTELFNQLDEQALQQVKNANDSSAD